MPATHDAARSGFPCGNERDTTLRVDAVTAASVSLGECVRHAVTEYFRALDGEPPCDNLHRVAIEQLEAPLFEVVMRHTDGNCSQAAKVLGISRATLRARLRQYGLVEPQ